MRPHLLIAASALALGACVLPLPRSATSSNEPRPEFASKRVSAKEAGSVLVAHDGTRCVAGEDRYRRTQLGEDVWCVWTAEGQQTSGAARKTGAPRPAWSSPGDLSRRTP